MRVRRATITLAVAGLALVGCDSLFEDDRDERAERCAAINRWSFQEGNSILDHPEYDWWQENC
jgi:hypothetical protein